MIGQFISIVPKDLKRNLAFRREMCQMAASDPKAADEFWQMCAIDPLFYFNTAVWIYEPRPKRSRVAEIPFITWDFQDEKFPAIFNAVENGEDLCAFKSRDMGASWIFLLAIDWLWRFRASLSFLLVSRNETYVDDPGNKKALFQKLDFVEERLPAFLRPNVRRVKLAKENLDNGSTIDGESTTGKVSRGDRRTMILLDEFAAFEIADGFAALASTQFATDCRFFNSTFEGTADAFYAVYKNPDIKKISLMWWEHPVFRQGLYIDANGKKRSPWYDEQCKKAGDPRIIARELDANPEGAQSQFFSSSEVDALKENCRPPLLTGDIEFEQGTSENPRFVPRAGGKLQLWVQPNEEGKIDPTIKCSIGADIATGTGASNSCLRGRDRESGRTLFQWTDCNTRPEKLADICVAIAKWFNGALIVPEAPGPGRNFIDRVVQDLRYSNVYYREQIRTIEKKRTMLPGWWPTPEEKWSVFGEYRRAMLAGTCDEPCEHTLRECLDYVFINNTIEHVKSIESNDPSGARDNHGDRPTASALSWKGCRYSPVTTEKAEPEVIPPNSIGGRKALRDKLRKQQELTWT